MRKRNNVVFARFSDEEYAMLMERLADTQQTINSYVINSALNATILSGEVIEMLKEQNRQLCEIEKQLRGIGTNLNQMAKKLNAGEQVSLESIPEMAEVVTALRGDVNYIWQSTRRLTSPQRVTVR